MVQTGDASSESRVGARVLRHAQRLGSTEPDESFAVDGDAMRARGVVVLFVRARNTQPNAMTKRMTSNTVSTAIGRSGPAPAFFSTAFIFL